MNYSEEQKQELLDFYKIAIPEMVKYHLVNMSKRKIELDIHNKMAIFEEIGDDAVQLAKVLQGCFEYEVNDA